MVENVLTIDLDMNSSTWPELLPIEPGTPTGMRDRNGAEIFEGDSILDYNHMGDDECYGDIKAGRSVKLGFPGVIRRAHYPEHPSLGVLWWKVVSEGGHEWHSGFKSGDLVEKICQ